MLGAGHFIGIKQGLTDKIKIDGHGQHIAINKARFFVFNRDIAANNLLHAPHAAAQKQLIGQIEANREHGNAQKRPHKIGLAFSGLGHSKEQQHQRHPAHKRCQKDVARGCQHALNGVNIKVLKEHALHMHGGLPKIKGIKNQC